MEANSDGIDLNSLSFQQFDKAAEDVKTLTTSPGNDDLLVLYALFKQGTVGDCNTSKWEYYNASSIRCLITFYLLGVT